jgi:rubrerythrin
METVLEILLALSALFFVGFPLFKPTLPQEEISERAKRKGSLESLIKKKNASYRLIKELEMDYKMGKLSLEDYQRLEYRYKQEAIKILQEIDSYHQVSSLEEQIEKEIEALRQSRKSKPTTTNLCPKCSWQVKPSDNFCPHCGQKLVS